MPGAIKPFIAAIYARVSTADQTCENQLLELRRYIDARGWMSVEYVDQGISGSKVQAVLCCRLDRLGRNLRHLVLLLDEWQSRGVTFVTLGEGIDTSTAARASGCGRSWIDRGIWTRRIQERIRAGLAPARAQGQRLGRRRSAAAGRLDDCAGLSHRETAARLGVSIATVKCWRRAGREGSESPSVVV
jgi:DNA invertase Pin-like site-specific DNA recombinase